MWRIVRVVSVDSPKPKRWRAFVCPDCRQVLRVPHDHAGLGIVCVACDRLLRLPAPGESPPLLAATETEPTSSRESGAFAHAQSRAADPAAAGVKRRRRTADDEEEIFDETFADKQEASPWMIQAGVASVALLGLIVVVTLLWPKGEREESVRAVAEPAAGETTAPAEGQPAEAESGERLLPIKLITDTLEPRIQAFLEAETLEEQARLVHRPDRALPRMREFHGDGYRPVGFRSVVWKAANRWQGDWAIVVVTDDEFEHRMIALNREDDWKISWEAMTGWSEVDWNTVKQQRPSETLLCRAMVKRSDYFNFGFADEGEWVCYFLSSPDGETGLYGYVRRGSEAHGKLDFLEGEQTSPFVLRIRYPDEAPADNQVLIEEVVARDWADDSES